MKKLRLEILDPTGNVAKTYNLDYYAGFGNRLRLTIGDNTYIMDSNGKLVILTQKEIDIEEQYKEHLKSVSAIKIGHSKTKDLRESPQYYNPETQKKQTLFEKLIPVFTVACVNDNLVNGDKGCAVYITVEAEDMEHAKDKAMLNEEFMSHIYDRPNFHRDSLRVHEPHGNYVLGKVLYFEGDPRL